MLYYSNESTAFVYANGETYTSNKKSHLQISFPSNNLLFIKKKKLQVCLHQFFKRP
jgi:hypothetical protein